MEHLIDIFAPAQEDDQRCYSQHALTPNPITLRSAQINCLKSSKKLKTASKGDFIQKWRREYDVAPLLNLPIETQVPKSPLKRPIKTYSKLDMQQYPPPLLVNPTRPLTISQSTFTPGGKIENENVHRDMRKKRKERSTQQFEAWKRGETAPTVARSKRKQSLPTLDATKEMEKVTAVALTTPFRIPRKKNVPITTTTVERCTDVELDYNQEPIIF